MIKYRIVHLGGEEWGKIRQITQFLIPPLPLRERAGVRGITRVVIPECSNRESGIAKKADFSDMIGTGRQALRERVGVRRLTNFLVPPLPLRERVGVRVEVKIYFELKGDFET
ncbi:MAG: hypothetical protein ABH836_04080 [Candidatus Omnitrophota bacterium]